MLGFDNNYTNKTARNNTAYLVLGEARRLDSLTGLSASGHGAGTVQGSAPELSWVMTNPGPWKLQGRGALCVLLLSLYIK